MVTMVSLIVALPRIFHGGYLALFLRSAEKLFAQMPVKPSIAIQLLLPTIHCIYVGSDNVPYASCFHSDWQPLVLGLTASPLPCKKVSGICWHFVIILFDLINAVYCFHGLVATLNVSLSCLNYHPLGAPGPDQLQDLDAGGQHGLQADLPEGLLRGSEVTRDHGGSRSAAVRLQQR